MCLSDSVGFKETDRSNSGEYFPQSLGSKYETLFAVKQQCEALELRLEIEFRSAGENVITSFSLNWDAVRTIYRLSITRIAAAQGV